MSIMCPKYSELRIKYLKNTSPPNIYRFKHIMSTSNTKTVKNLCKYISYAFKIREHALQNYNAIEVECIVH